MRQSLRFPTRISAVFAKKSMLSLGKQFKFPLPSGPVAKSVVIGSI